MAADAAFFLGNGAQLAAALLHLFIALVLFRVGLYSELRRLLFALVGLFDVGLFRFILGRLGFILLSERRAAGEGERTNDQSCKERFHLTVTASDWTVRV